MAAREYISNGSGVLYAVHAEMLEAGPISCFRELDNGWGSVVMSCCCYKPVAEAGDSSGTQRKGTSSIGSPYQAMAVKM
jgi:hypothetical protein